MVNNKRHFWILFSNFKKAYVTFFFFQIDIQDIRHVYNYIFYETIAATSMSKNVSDASFNLHVHSPSSSPNGEVAFYDWHASVTVLIPNSTVAYFIWIVGREEERTHIDL